MSEQILEPTMNDANIDHLLQVTATRAIWQTPSSLAGRSEYPAFGDHLAQASTPRLAAEPARPMDAPSAESERTNNHSSDVADQRRSELEANESSIASSSAERPPEDNQRRTVPLDVDATATESSKSGTNITDDDTRTSAIEEQEKNIVDDDQEHDDEAAELVAVTDAVAAEITLVSQVPPEAESKGEAADSPHPTGPAEHNSNADKPGNGPRRVVPQQSVETEMESLSSEDVVPTAAPPAHAETEQAGPASQVRANGHVSEQATPAESKTTVAAKPANSQSDRPPSISHRQRTPDDERHSAGGVPTAESAGETKQSEDARAKQEPASKEAEKRRDEPGESELPRSATGRPSPRAAATIQDLKLPLAVAVDSAQAENVQEVARQETTEESTRPPHTPAPRPETQLHALAQFHRVSGTIARVPGDSRAAEAPRVDPARFVNRVVKAFHAARESGGALQLRLSPPELGALRLELLVQDGVLAAKFEAETPTARRVLLDHLPTLRDRLAEQNIRIERFDVDVRHDGGGHLPSSPQQGRQQQSQYGPSQRPPSRQLAASPDPPAATSGSGGPISDTQINLVV